jgi:predicted  nucleic acid-binding Zn-ribbon protein
LFIPLFNFDFDNDLKDNSTPDIGADEFTPVDDFSLGADTGLCVGQSLTLLGGNNTGDINIWSTGDSTKTIMVNSAGSYTISLLNQCGVKQDTINVSIQELVNLPSDTNICAKQSITIASNVNNVQYNWNTGETTKSISISKPGVYSLKVQDLFGCVNSDTIMVTQSGLAEIQGDPIICGSQTAFLEALPSNSNYLWSNGSTNNIVTISNPGFYWVEVNDKNCITYDTVFVSSNQLSNADYNYVTSYLTFAVTQNNSIGDVHAWDFGDGNTSSLKKPTHTYSSPGFYNVTYSVSNICDTSSTTEEVVAIGVGLNKLNASESILVYPNPADDIVNVSLLDLPNGPVNMSIIDLKGSIVLENNINIISKNQVESINLNSLSSGVYILKVTSEGFSYYQRIEKK